MKKLGMILNLMTTIVFCDVSKELDIVKVKTDLASMATKSQVVREAMVNLIKKKAFPLSDLVVFYRFLSQIDFENRQKFKTILYEHGWPKISIYGEELCFQAWIIVFHSSKDISFQKYSLNLLEKALKTGEAKAEWYAILYDRIAIAEGRPQKYGTKIRENDELFPAQSN